MTRHISHRPPHTPFNLIARIAFALTALLIVTLLAPALLAPVPALAQDDIPTPEPVTLAAPDDDLMLAGHFYAAPDASDRAPAVLLMHMMNGRKTDWETLVPSLHDAGFAVLAIDLRGHGDTGGARDWTLAQHDLQAWIDWLRARDDIDPAAVSLGGASVGAMLALVGMAADADVVTAFALSPLLTLDALAMQDAIATIDARPVLLVAGHSDIQSADAVRELAQLAEGDVLLRLYPTHTHGTTLFREPRASDLPQQITAWLRFQNGLTSAN